MTLVSGVKGRSRVTKSRMLRKSLMPDSCNFVLKSGKLSTYCSAPFIVLKAFCLQVKLGTLLARLEL